MLNEEQVIDVASEEVVETEPEQPSFQTYIDEYREYKRQQRKNKEIRKQILNNQKAMRGFGYTYKEISYDS
jgi:hypothetical protein